MRDQKGENSVAEARMAEAEERSSMDRPDRKHEQMLHAALSIVERQAPVVCHTGPVVEGAAREQAALAAFQSMIDPGECPGVWMASLCRPPRSSTHPYSVHRVVSADMITEDRWPNPPGGRVLNIHSVTNVSIGTPSKSDFAR